MKREVFFRLIPTHEELIIAHLIRLTIKIQLPPHNTGNSLAL